jgi:hypothetical protein
MHRIHKSFLTLAVTASVLLGASIAVTPASAATATFNWSGTIISDPFGLLGGSGVGTVSGTFAFDNSPATGGTYPSVVSSLTATFNNALDNFSNPVPYIISSIPGNLGTVQVSVGLNNGNPTPGLDIFDRWNLHTDVTSPNPPISNFWSPFRADVTMDRLEAISPFGSTDMRNPPSLATVFLPQQPSVFRVLFQDLSGTSLVPVGVNITNLTLAPVPLPSAVILFGAGLVALIGLGARNWQRKTVGGMRLEV